ncbi:hypothetical protein Salat_1960600 [Sesamum alatum]|uniref:RRM domain-containing protein n=1 Tax=Sesamum alatum TaxID=300844 RepID=A0AAE1Y5K6_9LAMI|nr:hypothetical protein Salat_1960600 [Sesamum alatum]
MNSRKREKPYSRHAPYSLPKRRRPLPLDAAAGEDAVDDSSTSSTAAKAPTSVVVIGVPAECSVLDLKSRFEMYGPISRTRMEPNGVAYINFRSNDAANPPSMRLEIQVFRVNPALNSSTGDVGERSSSTMEGRTWPEGRIIIKANENKSNKNTNGDATNDDNANSADAVGNSGLDGSFKGREIVAYDDIFVSCGGVLWLP